MQALVFGKHKGRQISDPNVETDYLVWLRDRCQKDVTDLNEEIQRREREADVQLPIVERIIQCGFRNLAQEYHPDHGGNANHMRELLDAKALLTKVVKHMHD